MTDVRANVTELEKTGRHAMRPAPGVEQERERYSTPLTDVIETEDAITLMMDLPGVNRQDLNVDCEKDALKIVGRQRRQSFEGMEPVHQESDAIVWRREFALPGEIELDKVEAVFKDGVLRVTLPKSDRVKPRKISVKTS